MIRIPEAAIIEFGPNVAGSFFLGAAACFSAGQTDLLSSALTWLKVFRAEAGKGKTLPPGYGNFAERIHEISFPPQTT